MNDRNLRCNINNNVFKNYADKIKVYLKSSNSKGANYDPHRNVGFVSTNSNPLTVKALITQIAPETKLAKEIGHFISGAILATIYSKDVTLIRSASKIEYNDEEYSVYNKALGNRIQITDTGVGFHKVVLFRKGD